MVPAERLVLQAGLVGAHALDHQALVFLGEALGAHRAVGQPVQHEEAPDDREAAVADEDGLPGVDRGRIRDEGEAVGEEAANDLLTTVHLDDGS